MTTSLGGDQVKRTSTSKPATTERHEAKHWIERQLRWERTLGALRHQRTDPEPVEQAA